ncbi:MAG: hypothetical protein LBR17_05430 [Bacteroidales bacterium]|jgi:hypothetical protein|nr:hypothetical protein [Bacteroidales bacterium]
MKKLFLLFIASGFFAFSSMAQESNFSVGADFQSRYVWRGLPLGANVPSIQPAATFSWNGLSIGAWGAFQTVGFTSQELDLYISYTFLDEMLSVIVTDYCFPDDGIGTFKYFEYGSNTTPHIFEAGVTFNGLKDLPIKAGFYMNFYGNDKKPASQDNAFSSYAEVSYNPSIEKWGVDLSVFAGCALTGYAYGVDGFGFINLGLGITKQLKITDAFSLPIYTRLIFNPDANKSYFVLGTGFSI